jgi:uncharacterized protein involved in exopolysaccharide biosynthesis
MNENKTPATGVGRQSFGSTRDLLSLIFRRRAIGLSIFSLIFAASVVSMSQQRVVYLSEARILVQRGQGGAYGAIPRPVLHWWEEMKSEVEIVRSRPVAERASTALARRQLAEGPDGTELKPASPPSPEDLLDGLSVEPIDETDIIRISYRALDRWTAIESVNAIADAYLDHRREMKQNQQAAEFFEEKIQDARSEVERARAEYALYKTQHGLADITQQTDELIRQRASLENDLTVVRTDRAGRESEIEVLDRSRRENPDVLVPTPELNSDANLQSYQRRLADLEGRLTSLRSTYTTESPQVQAVMRDVEGCKEAIRKVVSDMITAKRNELGVLRGREQSLNAEIQEIDRKLNTLPEHEAKLAFINQELKTSTDQLIGLEARHQEHRLQEAVDPRLSNLQLLAHAVTAKRIGGGARQKLFLVFSFVLALGMALVAAFLVDTLDHTLKFPVDVESALGIPVLASVREVKVGRTQRRAGRAA